MRLADQVTTIRQVKQMLRFAHCVVITIDESDSPSESASQRLRQAHQPVLGVKKPMAELAVAS